MRLLLYSNNKWIEPEFDRESNELSLDWHYGSLESPADYIGEYAYDFKLPRSQKNNELFNKYYRVDGLVDPATFDPAVKLPYNIVSDRGRVISTGTAYIQLIDQSYYRMYLSGALHTIFSKALNSGWSTSTAAEDEDYYLLPEYIKIDQNGDYTANPLMNADLMYYNWRWYNRDFDWYDFITSASIYSSDNWSKIVANNIVSWIPTHQGALDDFDKDKWLYKASDGSTQEYTMFMKTPGEPGMQFQLADDPTEYQMAEFRIYNQQPAVYVKRLWEWYQDRFEDITGYTLTLDPGWYNQENPYIKDLFYTLPKIKKNFIYQSEDVTLDAVNTSETCGIYKANWSQAYANTIHTTNYIYFPENYQGGEITVNWFPWINGSTGVCYWNWYDQCFLVTIKVVGADGTIKYQRKHAMLVIPWPSDGTPLNPSSDVMQWAQNSSNADEFHYMRTASDWNDSSHYYFQYVFADEVGKSYDFTFNCVCEDTDHIEVETRLHSVNGQYPWYTGYHTTDVDDDNIFSWWDDVFGGTYHRGDPMSPTFVFNTTLQCRCTAYGESKSYESRSNSPLSMERLFESEKPFPILLKYSKYMNLVWVVDDYNKNVTVYERSQHFYECMNENGTSLPSTGDDSLSVTGILDISEKIDCSSDVQVKPIDWGYQYLNLNFEPSGADWLKDYNEKWKRSYGSKTLKTINKRSGNAQDMFCNGDNDTVVEACDISPFYIPISTVMSYKPIAYRSDTLLNNLSDGGTADVHGQFVFRNPNERWSSDLYSGYRTNVNGVLLSDDTIYEVNEQKYFYHGNKIGTDKATTYKPVFSPVHTPSNSAFWFAFPRTAYAPLNYAQDTYLVYEKWKNYLMEIYDINNKTLSCKVHLSDTEYNRIKLNPLVKIDNCVYIMVSMEGYNENSDWIKCTLKQFGSIEGLTAGAMAGEGGDVEGNIWLWDDETPVYFDDNNTMRIGDGYRLPDIPRPYEPLVPDEPIPNIPATIDKVRRYSNSGLGVLDTDYVSDRINILQ